MSDDPTPANLPLLVNETFMRIWRTIKTTFKASRIRGNRLGILIVMLEGIIIHQETNNLTKCWGKYIKEATTQ